VPFSNEVGPSQHEVELSGLPHPEHIHPAEKKEPLKYGVKMRVKSISPVKEYRITWQEVNETHEGEKSNVTILTEEKDLINQDGEVKVYERTYIISELRPSTNYSISMAAHNDFGWSKSTDVHKFYIDDNKNGAASAQGGQGSGGSRALHQFHVVVLSFFTVWLSWRTTDRFFH